MKRYDLEDTNKYGYEPRMSMEESIDGDYILFTDHEEAIKQAVAAEREACAEVAENYISTDDNNHDKWTVSRSLRAFRTAAAIRQRGEK